MNKKSILVGIAVLLLAVVGGIAGATYSRYISSASTTPTAKVAKWVVKVNNTDITQAGTTTFQAPITWEENENIAEGVIAPGRTGTATLTIDPSGSQVAVKYSITIGDMTSTGSTNPIEIESVTITDPTETNLENSGKTYSKVLGLNDLKAHTVTIKVKWNSTFNDENDTAAGVEAPTISIPLTVTAEQFIASE